MGYQDEVTLKNLKLISADEFETNSRLNNIEDGYIVLNKQRIDFEEKEVIKDTIFMYLPTEFRILPKELARLKYLTDNPSEYIFTSKDTTFSLLFTWETEIKDVEILRNITMDYFIRLNPNSKIIQYDSTPQKNIPFFVYESNAIDDELCNVTFFVRVKEKVFLGTLSKPQNDYNLWKEIFLQMIDSIEIKV